MLNHCTVFPIKTTDYYLNAAATFITKQYKMNLIFIFIFIYIYICIKMKLLLLLILYITKIYTCIDLFKNNTKVIAKLISVRVTSKRATSLFETSFTTALVKFICEYKMACLYLCFL